MLYVFVGIPLVFSAFFLFIVVNSIQHKDIKAATNSLKLSFLSFLVSGMFYWLLR